LIPISPSEDQLDQVWKKRTLKRRTVSKVEDLCSNSRSDFKIERGEERRN